MKQEQNHMYKENEHEMQPASVAPEPAGILIILDLVAAGINPCQQKTVTGSDARPHSRGIQYHSRISTSTV